MLSQIGLSEQILQVSGAVAASEIDILSPCFRQKYVDAKMLGKLNTPNSRDSLPHKEFQHTWAAPIWMKYVHSGESGLNNEFGH